MRTSNPVLELERVTAVLALEKTLMSAEDAAGIGWEGAARPLYAHERDSKVRFRDLHTILDRGAKRVAGVLADLTDVVHVALYTALDGVTGVEDAIGVMLDLRSAQPVEVRDAEIAAADAIETILADVYRQGSKQSFLEAYRQGVPDARGREALDPETLEFRPAAMAAAMGPWNRSFAAIQLTLLDTNFLLTDPRQVSELAGLPRRRGKKFGAGIKIPQPSAYRPGLNVPGEIIDLVDTAVKKSTARSTDTAKQEVHVAHGKGRNRAAKKMKPSLIFASEMLDGRTCEKCAAVDGKEYRSTTAAKKDYPFGPYKNCLGGNRCRGTLIFIYGTPAAAPGRN